MRTIKFKALTLDGKKWVFGDLHIQEDGVVIGVHYVTEHFDEGRQNAFKWVDVIPETVCQFTGLLDKNGVEIYEGDYDVEGNCVTWCARCNGWEFAQIDVPTRYICIPCHRCDGNFFFEDHIIDFEISVFLSHNIYDK